MGLCETVATAPLPAARGAAPARTAAAASKAAAAPAEATPATKTATPAKSATKTTAKPSALARIAVTAQPRDVVIAPLGVVAVLAGKAALAPPGMAVGGAA